MFYLLDHPNPNGNHFYPSRLRGIKAQVIHITAGLEDIDLRGPDSTAEGEAHYAATTSRQVSWHTGSDTDSFVNLLPYSYTAFQVVNYNSSTAGHEISKLETNWSDDDPAVIHARLYWAAEAIREPMKAAGIPFRRSNKAELDHAIATNGPPVGLVGHYMLDPSRRSDPGLSHGVDTFPWNQFIAMLKNRPGTEPDDMFTDKDRQLLTRVNQMLSENNTVGDVNSLVTDMAVVKADVEAIKTKLDQPTPAP